MEFTRKMKRNAPSHFDSELTSCQKRGRSSKPLEFVEPSLGTWVLNNMIDAIRSESPACFRSEPPGRAPLALANC